jgi:hypothetical protein
MSAVNKTPIPGASLITVGEVRRRAAPVLLAHPRLTNNGWHVGRLPLTGRDAFDYEQVRTALVFLLFFARRRLTFNRKAYSYGLKHRAENWGRANELSPYISNGAFILGALIGGYQHRQAPYGGWNCAFNMSVDRATRCYDLPVSELRSPGRTYQSAT